jgi:hypothetical protein
LVYVTTRAGVPLAVGGVLFFLAGIGVVRALRSGLGSPAAVGVLVVGYKAAVHIPLKLEYWYRVTMEPFLMVFVGIGVAALLSEIEKRS